MSQYSSAIRTVALNALYRSYGWMSAGIFITSFIAYAIYSSPTASVFVFTHSWIMWVAIISQLVCTVALSAGFNKMSYPALSLLFLSYTALSGITLSSLLFVFEMSSIIGVLFITCGIFALLSLYGMYTKQDLGPVGSFLLIALFGMFIASLINLFFKSAGFDYVLSLMGVFIFALWTAYDTQNMKNVLAEYANDNVAMQKLSIIGAFTFYLNFINLFINLLKVLGKKKDH